MFLKCNNCSKRAVWMYMPNSKMRYCDTHVPRGCFCNEDENGVADKDDQGRLLPCVEYDYDASGFEESWDE